MLLQLRLPGIKGNFIIIVQMLINARECSHSKMTMNFCFACQGRLTSALSSSDDHDEKRMIKKTLICFRVASQASARGLKSALSAQTVQDPG